MYGREGILAHPYMLGPDGQSNGCISVQDYPKFLEAFLNGKFDRLIVVPKVGDTLPMLQMPLPEMTNGMPRNDDTARSSLRLANPDRWHAKDGHHLFSLGRIRG